MTDIAERARELMGVPFVHQGRDRNGIDCVGLLAHAVDYPFELIPAYGRDPHNGLLERSMSAAFGEPLYSKPPAYLLQSGDLVGMQYRGPVRHVGIVLNHLTLPGVLSLIHTDSMVGKVTEHILDDKWLRRIEFVWRLGTV